MSPPVREVTVRTGESGSYPVRIGAGVRRELPDLLARLVGAHRYAVVADDRVMRLHGDEILRPLAEAGLVADPFSFPAGERSKTRHVWATLSDRMIEAGFGRDGCVVALGGGVTGDLAGFVAATYMRGLPLVQIPTSLVAMVDSSVGGKTAVDVPGGKNLVGAFHPPRLVLSDPELCATLPREERSQGLAEAVKHGAILDADYLRDIEAHAEALLEGDPEATAEVVARSVELKAEVVGADEREAGLRQILNFGHTLGHALEALSEYQVPHGSAVATGMVLEAELGEALEVTDRGTAGELARILRYLELPTRLRSGSGADDLVSHVARDKKVREGRARYVLLRRLGEVEPGEGWTHAVAPGVVREVASRGRDGSAVETRSPQV